MSVRKAMYKRICLFLSLLPFALQAQATDTALSEQLLREVREMRQDLQGLTLVAQRVQLLLYRAQLQENTVRRCLSRYEAAKSKVADVERKRATLDAAYKEWTEKQAAPVNPGDDFAAAGMVRDVRRQLDTMARDESQARSEEAEAARELRAEEAKLSEFQARLDRMERQLEAFPGGKPAK